MKVVYLVVDTEETFELCKNTRSAHAKFSWFETLYNDNDPLLHTSQK